MWQLLLLVPLVLLIPAYADYYDSEEKLITSPPTVCTIPPNDSMIPDVVKTQYMKVTKDGIMEWQYMLQSIAKKPKNWTITYLEGDYPNCDITISFKRYMNDTDYARYYDVLGRMLDGKMELYYQEFTSCGDHGESRCYWDDVAPSSEVGTVVKHEFGHALGLGHYISDQEYQGNGQVISIMNPYSDKMTDVDRIQEIDLRKVIEIYGQDGFNQDSKIIPSWLKNNALWFSEGQIDESQYVEGLKYLIKNNIIHTDAKSSGSESKVPDWIKNNSEWWANGKITDIDYFKGIEFMINKGIIRI